MPAPSTSVCPRRWRLWRPRRGAWRRRPRRGLGRRSGAPGAKPGPPQRPLAGLAGSANSYVEGLPRVCQGSGRCRPSGLHAAAEGTRPRSRV